MESMILSETDSLLKAANTMHDFYFTKEDVSYDKKNNTFILKAKEYEWKGKLLQRKTNIIKGEGTLMLFNINRCDILENDSQGYNSVGEDCFNLIEVKNDNCFILKSSFHEIILDMDKLDGRFEYRTSLEEQLG